MEIAQCCECENLTLLRAQGQLQCKYGRMATSKTSRGSLVKFNYKQNTHLPTGENA